MSRLTRSTFTLSTVAVISLITLIIGIVIARLFVPASTHAVGNAPASGKHIDVIVKATDSSFWQAMLAGSKAAGKDWGVQVELFGATSEADVAGQVRLMENSISRNVDAIVVAPSSFWLSTLTVCRNATFVGQVAPHKYPSLGTEGKGAVSPLYPRSTI